MNKINNKKGVTMKHLRSIAAIFLVFFVGCSDDSNINSPTIDDSTVKTGSTLAKNIHSSEPFLVTAGTGGIGRLIYTDGNVNATVILKFFPYSVINDIWVTITLDETNLTGGIHLEFGPHENTFLKPAQLDITLVGMPYTSLKDINSVYYLGNGNNVLDQMMYKKLIVQADRGALKLLQAQIPHFSRYGFMRKNQ